MTPEALGALAEPALRAALERCCGARAWIAAMLGTRPWRTREDLHAAADRSFAALADADWVEAFAHHPRIGDLDGLRRRFATTAVWAGDEQSGTASAADETLQALARGNADYEARFGHLFIVCATGLAADEMLARLRARLPNDAAAELRHAAAEQAKITHLRLDKLLEEA